MRIASIHVRLTREEYAKLAARAQAAGLSVSDLLRAAIQPVLAGTRLRVPVGQRERRRGAVERGQEQAGDAAGGRETGGAS
jgi:hypothetical protein